MGKIWVVVANSAQAQIFETKWLRGPLELRETLEHPESRLKERDLVSDTHGRSFDSGGQGRHAMEDKTSAKKHEFLQFAKKIADHIESARTANRFDELALVAAPEFLGQLRQTISAPCRERVIKTVDKNLVGQDTTGISKQLFE